MVRFSTSFLCLERDKTTTVVCLLPKIVLLSSFVSLFKRRAGVSPYRVRRHDATAFCRCARALRLVQRCRRARLLRARSSVPRRRRRRRRTHALLGEGDRSSSSSSEEDENGQKSYLFLVFFTQNEILKIVSKKRGFKKKKKERKRKPSSKKKTND